jgi:DNA-binding CsgD family transcriptional regulator
VSAAAAPLTGPAAATRLARQVHAQVLHLLSTCPACAERDALREAAFHQIQGQLTPRRLEVLGFAADGLSSDQIAARLCITPSTVHTHLQWLHAAFGVQSRPALVAKAFRAGVIE